MSTKPNFKVNEILATYEVSNGLFLLGALEKGLTLYNQQVRAHNLAWSLWHLHIAGDRPIGRVAVIGAGASGLTVTAALLARFKGEIDICLFEQLWDLCPIQQGADARWIHPRIYGWPREGSRAPGASLPILNWSEGRASDVARSLVRGFGALCEQYESPTHHPMRVILGLRQLRLHVARREIDWVGTKAERNGQFFLRGKTEGNIEKFDTIIVASGFGLERRHDKFPVPSYWRNEQIAQPHLDGQQRRFVVSGYGDGALVDLCRLTIERFRQDTILYELFGSDLEKFESIFREQLGRSGRDKNIFEYFRSIDDSHLKEPRLQLSSRIRKDTLVTLHIRGRENNVKEFSDIFGPTSSYLNRILTYLLSRCGAFSTNFDDLSNLVERESLNPEVVVCRHGADTEKLLEDLIVDYDIIKTRLKDIKTAQLQTSEKLWPPGIFPVVDHGGQR